MYNSSIPTKKEPIMSSAIREFVGVYHAVNRPNQRIPVMKQGDRYVDFMGKTIDIKKMVKVD